MHLAEPSAASLLPLRAQVRIHARGFQRGPGGKGSMMLPAKCCLLPVGHRGWLGCSGRGVKTVSGVLWAGARATNKE